MAIQIALCFGDICSGFCSTTLCVLFKSENLFLFFQRNLKKRKTKKKSKSWARNRKTLFSLYIVQLTVDRFTFRFLKKGWPLSPKKNDTKKKNNCTFIICTGKENAMQKIENKLDGKSIFDKVVFGILIEVFSPIVRCIRL